MLLAIGILGALYQRQTTDRGRRVQIAMQDAQLQYARGTFVQHSRSGQPAMRNGAKPLTSGMDEPSFAERGIIQTMQHPNGEFRLPAFPVRFDGTPAPVKPSPLLGEHTT
jgi:crotonobetainyl-CoA:carnitine CoA-transferase CaiB-like acyl-CoA transferase